MDKKIIRSYRKEIKEAKKAINTLIKMDDDGLLHYECIDKLVGFLHVRVKNAKSTIKFMKEDT